MLNSGVVTPTIAHDIKIAVPASPRLLTTFVLHEQRDWFEDELRFIRRFVRPGMLAVDIGANYGVYALTIATLTGVTGHVWAFEPTSATCGYLRQSITENQLGNVTLVQAGLSNRLGEAKLFTSPNSELNSLSTSNGADSETIRLLTLDHCRQEFEWTHLDFIKLDAEGEETRILAAAHETLATLSPLIMFELKHGSTLNLPLLESFAKLGYECYRLVPGLNALMKFDAQAPCDGYLLNLFCCKPDRANRLEHDGLLVGEPQHAHSSRTQSGRMGLARLPTSITELNADDSGTSGEYRGVLDDYLLSLSDTASNAERLGHLLRSVDGARQLLSKSEHRTECLATLSRIAFDAGERTLGVQILADLIARHATELDIQVGEAFLPASQRYDDLPPGGNLNAWLLASILEQYIEKHAFSTYFSGTACLPLFEQLERLGFLSEPMRRRYYLTKARAATN